jgi:hypothetical protein
VKSLEGLYLTSFDASKIKVSRKVQEFYNSISIIDKKEVPIVVAEPVAIPIAIAVAVPINEENT